MNSRKPSQRAQKVAEHFLQTVVVVDDQFFYSDESSVEDIEPETLELPEESDQQEFDSSDPVDRDAYLKAVGVDGKALTDAFADRGLTCVLLSPSLGDVDDAILNDRVFRLAERSDAFVLDWIMANDEGENALSLIERLLLAKDEKTGYRFRLICVYTNQIDLVAIRDRIQARIEEVAPGLSVLRDESESGDSNVVQGYHFRVCVLAKSSVPVGGKSSISSVTEEKLPDRLIAEFALATDGLLRGLALEALAVLRDSATKLLQRLDSRLDPAYVSHALLTGDSEQFAIQLVLQEFEAVLEAAEVRSLMTRDHLVEWVRALIVDPSFSPALAKAPGVEVEVHKDWVLFLIENTANALAKPIGPDGKNELKTLKARATLTRVFTRDAKSAEEADHRLGRMSCLARTHADALTNEPPTLGLGTVLYGNAGEDIAIYWVCLQPACDSVRVDKARGYPLLPLHQVDRGKEFDIVLLDFDNKPVELKSSSHPYEMIIPRFAPSGGVVRAVQAEGGTFQFSSENEQYGDFSWLAELRPDHARRIAHTAAIGVNRIGLDESEWLRMSGRNK